MESNETLPINQFSNYYKSGNRKKKISAGGIVAIILCSIVAISVLIGLIIFLRRKNKRENGGMEKSEFVTIEKSNV